MIIATLIDERGLKMRLHDVAWKVSDPETTGDPLSTTN